jgi:large conductance mechanosensitive channel
MIPPGRRGPYDSRMLKLWREFKTFALSGNVFDLALGFLIGAAFSKLVESLADNVLMQLVAAIFGEPDFHKWHVTIHKTQIKYGNFLTDLMSFFMLAGVLFLIVKIMSVTGFSRLRNYDERQCPYCLEPVSPDALVCKTCTRPLVADLPDYAAAVERAEALRAYRLPRLPNVNLPPLPVPKLRRRTGATQPESVDSDAVTTGAVAGAVTASDVVQDVGKPDLS